MVCFLSSIVIDVGYSSNFLKIVKAWDLVQYLLESILRSIESPIGLCQSVQFNA